jgi:uncharacterized protein with HEPN domain
LIDFEPGKENFDNYMAVYDIFENLFRDGKAEIVTKNGLSKHTAPKISNNVLYVQGTGWVFEAYPEECEYLLSVKQDLSKDGFLDDETLKRAVVRSLEIIGEATKKVPADYKVKWNSIQWKNMAGMRDRLIHDYIGVNYPIVWNVFKNKIPGLYDQSKASLKRTKTTANQCIAAGRTGCRINRL